MCKECENEDCPGMDKLRQFDNWNDLSSHASEEKLVEWVNHYAQMIDARNESGRRYRVRQQTLAKVARKYLDADEIERVTQLAQERAV